MPAHSRRTPDTRRARFRLCTLFVGESPISRYPEHALSFLKQDLVYEHLHYGKCSVLPSWPLPSPVQPRRQLSPLTSPALVKLRRFLSLIAWAAHMVSSIFLMSLRSASVPNSRQRAKTRQSCGCLYSFHAPFVPNLQAAPPCAPIGASISVLSTRTLASRKSASTPSWMMTCPRT